jgi:hypothetical protein
MRDDLEAKELAISLGYEIEYHHQDKLNKRFDNPFFPIMFKKFKKHIWKVKDGWMCADLINGNFTNHRRYPDVKIALENERFGF